MTAYQKRLVKWEQAEDGWVFAKHCEYTICPSQKKEGYSELWRKGELISTRKTIPMCKKDADKHERG